MAIHATAHTYGREAQEALQAAVQQCKTIDGTYDPLAPVTIVVPSALSGYHIRRSFGRLPGGLVNVQVKPLRALLELIGSGPLANQGERPLGDAYRHEAIRAVAEADRSAFGDLPIEDAMLRTLEQRFAEFDQCDDDALDLITRGGDVPRYLVDRYRAFRELTANFYSNRDLSESAITALSGQPSALNDIGSVIVYLPGDMTSSERRFLDALERHTGVRVIVGLSGDAESVDNRVVERWGLSGETARPSVPHAQRILQAPDPEEEVRSAIRDIAASLQSADPTRCIGQRFSTANRIPMPGSALNSSTPPAFHGTAATREPWVRASPAACSPESSGCCRNRRHPGPTMSPPGSGQGRSETAMEVPRRQHVGINSREAPISTAAPRTGSSGCNAIAPIGGTTSSVCSETRTTNGRDVCRGSEAKSPRLTCWSGSQRN